MSYVPPSETLSASWAGADSYSGPIRVINATWAVGGAQEVLPVGFDALSTGEPTLTQQQFIGHDGFDASEFAQPILTLDWQYPPQYRVVNASWAGQEAYSRPVASLNVQWSATVGPISAQYANPEGFDAQAIGDAVARNAVEYLAPTGFDAQGHGQPTIWNLNQYLKLGGIGSKLAWGRPTVQNKDRYLTVTGFDAKAFGTVFMQGGVVQLQLNGIAAPSQSQRPWLSFSPRWLTTSPIPAPGLPVPLVGGTRYVEPSGFEATAWGERIIPEARTIYTEGQSLTLWGDPFPWNYTTLVRPEPVAWQAEEQRWGQNSVWNWQRYITQFHEAEHVDQFGSWTGVENRNRVITHHSTAPAVIPSPSVDNGARALLPAGIEAPAEPEYYRAGMVAYRVRELPIDGIEAPDPSYWLTVANGAKVLAPSGLDAQAHGLATLENTRRYFPYISGGDQQIIGTPMVADRIRTLSFESRYGISPPQIDLPEVKLHTRYVEPSGHEASGMGGHELRIHWTIVTPRWTHRDLVGEPAVRNVTPELPVYGHNSEEFGQAQVRTQWRELLTRELYGTLFGLSRISDRRQTVQLAGIDAMRIGDKLKVERTGPYIPEAQYIIHIDPHGYFPETMPRPDDHGVGEPTLNSQSAYPESWVADRFGEPTVELMGISPVGMNDFVFGEHAVDLLHRVITVSEYHWDPNQLGDARVSPHTVKPSTFPYQPPELGRPVVTNRNRTVSAHGASHVSLGAPRISNRTHFIYPEGMRARFGFPRVSDGSQALMGIGFDSTAIGTATVGRPAVVRDTIEPPGFYGAFGNQRIEHFNRAVTPQAWDSSRLGASGTSPRFMPQRLHVGPPDWPTMDGFCAEEYGMPWVSLRVRDVFVPGSDQFLCEYDFYNFSLRMRVSPRPVSGPAARTLEPAGFDALAAGVVNISNWVQYIRPDGNMDNFRKGAPT